MDCRIKSGNDDWKALRPQYSTRRPDGSRDRAGWSLANEIRYRLRYNNPCLAVSMGEGHAPANADGVALHPVPAAAALHRSNFASGRRACTGQSVKRAKPDARSDVLHRRRARRARRTAERRCQGRRLRKHVGRPQERPHRSDQRSRCAYGAQPDGRADARHGDVYVLPPAERPGCRPDRAAALVSLPRTRSINWRSGLRRSWMRRPLPMPVRREKWSWRSPATGRTIKQSPAWCRISRSSSGAGTATRTKAPLGRSSRRKRWSKSHRRARAWIRRRSCSMRSIIRRSRSISRFRPQCFLPSTSRCAVAGSSAGAPAIQ